MLGLTRPFLVIDETANRCLPVAPYVFFFLPFPTLAYARMFFFSPKYSIYFLSPRGGSIFGQDFEEIPSKERIEASHPSWVGSRSNINFAVTTFRHPPVSRDPYGNGDRSSESSLRVETSPRGSNRLSPLGSYGRRKVESFSLLRIILLSDIGIAGIRRRDVFERGENPLSILSL